LVYKIHFKKCSSKKTGAKAPVLLTNSNFLSGFILIKEINRQKAEIKQQKAREHYNAGPWPMHHFKQKRRAKHKAG